MADADPYAQFLGDKVSSKKLGDLVTEDPYAQFVQKQPGTLEDMAKVAPGALTTGILAPAGMGGDLQGMMPEKSSWLEKTFPTITNFLKKDTAAHPLGGLGQGLQQGTGDVPGTYKLPSTKELKSGVEKVTGPMDYQAQTPGGKILDTALKVAPSIAMGGESIPGLIAKSVGSGVTSEGAGELANRYKGLLPTSAQPYAEPVARAVGAFGGAFTPAGARRAVTPNPMSDAQQAAVQALPRGFPMTAGQATESPNLMRLEARSPNAQGVAESQGPAFTGAAMGEAGIPSNRFSDIGQGDLVGQRLGALYQSGRISQPEFQQLLQQIGAERRVAQRAVGLNQTPQLDATRDMVRFGAQNRPGTPVFDMPGQRYEFMRGEIQRRIDAAVSPQEKQALSNIRNHMDTAFNNSTGLGDQTTPLQQQYANWNVLKNIPPRVGRDTLDPQDVLSAVGHGWGNAAANTGRGTLAPLAQNAGRVMTPLPPPSPEGPLARVAGALGGLLLGGGVGHSTSGMPGAVSEGIVGAILGGERGHDVAQLAKNMAGRVVGSRPAQAYLGNQAWRPGPHTSADPDLMARLLMAPPVNQIGGQ
jgi:hypothetical protein